LQIKTEQLVEPEHVGTLAAILIKVRRLPRRMRRGAMQIWLAPHAIVDVGVLEAALARLRAASLLDLGAKLEEFSVEALTEAIASTPLHPIGQHYYFDLDEFMRVLAKSEASLKAQLPPGRLGFAEQADVRRVQ
jgi:hypothetical protein